MNLKGRKTGLLLPQGALLAAWAAFGLSFNPVFSQEPQAGALAPGEIEIINSCEKNFLPSDLNPFTAENCLGTLNANNADLLNRLRQADNPRAVNLVAKASALSGLKKIMLELADFLNKPDKEGSFIYYSGFWLGRQLSSENLAELGLGPQPEKVKAWMETRLGNYFPQDRQTLVAKAFRLWSGLNDYQKQLLSELFKIGQPEWEALPFGKRLEVLHDVATVALKLAQDDSAGKFTVEQVDKNAEKLDPLWFDMDDNQRDEFNGFQKKLFTLAKAKEELENRLKSPAVKADEKKKLEGIKRDFEKLKKADLNRQLAYLGGFFDLSKLPGVDQYLSNVSPYPPGPTQNFSGRNLLSDQQTATLLELFKTAFTDEIRGTKTGDAVIRFYSAPSNTGANKLQLKLAPSKNSPNAFAWYYPPDKTIYFPREMIEKWMKDNNCTARDLFDGKTGKLKAFARYLSPVFVHESTHQRQHDWSIRNGVPFFYQHEMEVEAFTAESIFMLEKAPQEAAKKNSLYFKELPEGQLEIANTFKESGMDGLRPVISQYYKALPAYNEAWAGEFGIASGIYAELQKRRSRDPKEEKLLDARRNKPFGEFVDIKTRDLEKLLNSYFPSYEKYNKRQVETEAWAEQARNEILTRQPGDAPEAGEQVIIPLLHR